MGTVMLSRVKNTRKMLRQHIIETILNEFDEQCMELTREQRQEKYKKMMESPFRFFRGSAYLFYYDMSNVPFSFHTPADKPTWIQGDLHMENFGVFQNEQGEIVYDVNDFDEGYIGSYLYDVLRMSISIALFCDAQSLSEEEQKERIIHYLQAYYKQLKRFNKKKDNPFTLTFKKENTTGPVNKVLKKLLKRQTNHLLRDITYINEENKRIFAWSDEIKPVNEKERHTLMSLWETYIHSIDPEDKRDRFHYSIKDIARKSGSGTASIGLDRYYILVEGGKEAHGQDDLVLEVKEVRTPVPAYFLPYRELFWQKYQHQGHRVITTQKAMHHMEDPYLGYLTIDGRHFYVRERSPYKKKVKAKLIPTIADMDSTLDIMGKITAKIHARADVDFLDELFSHHSEEEILLAIGDQFETFCSQIVFSSITYKEQVKRDYELFCEWVKKAFHESEEPIMKS
ncbi:DUF2252 domain-containing protein [Niallia endozanthoxylica]|uniref:DUF2252 domain-containing protein n=1 Tax=Niallia endozanthoxylica TaxID=2036016 RepID=A0A5J5H716_9BACI|nr:DUF2252 family protein [Niallia endozanthoxylica]KAA9016485.1 DUF2252 domain-containing protein [Niallia endozanthoxylica]